MSYFFKIAQKGTHLKRMTKFLRFLLFTIYHFTQK